MNKTLQIFLVNDEVRGVTVTYAPEGGRYTFKTFDDTLKVDDYVIVESTNSNNSTNSTNPHGFVICQVVETDVEIDLDSPHTYKWVVGRVDTEAHNELLRQEQIVIARIAKAEKRRKRKKLAETLLDDTNGELKELPIYNREEDRTDQSTER
jgi:hypothetical protein